MTYVAIREFGKLVAAGQFQNLDLVSIPASAFDYLRSRMYDSGGEGEIHRLLAPTRHGHYEALQVRNYVGVLQTPCGTQLEILPKLPLEDGYSDRVGPARRLLLTMLSTLAHTPFKVTDATRLATTKGPLLDIYFGEFLQQVSRLLKKGLQSDYLAVEDNLPVLKGKLLVSNQLRANYLHPERFYVSYDEFSANRAENRLIKSALCIVRRSARSERHQRLCRELLFAFDDVPSSNNVQGDFARCVDDRNLAHYERALRWCRLILENERPGISPGGHRAVAILHPMERLFQDYVAVRLAMQFPTWRIKTQASAKYLARQGDTRYFQLKPDLLLYGDAGVRVGDTKWKVLNAGMAEPSKKYGLSQSDFYQLFAYAKKYIPPQQVEKDIWAIYPAHAGFRRPLEPFFLEEDLALHVLPFDVETGMLITE